MKKLISVLLVCVFLLTSCTGGGNTVSTPENESTPTVSVDESSTAEASEEVSAEVPEEVSKENSTETSEEISTEVSEETSKEEIVKNYPYVTGTFVQLWAFGSYSAEKWESHFNSLKEVGIDTVIIQWTATTPDGVFKDCYYNTALAADNKTADYTQYSSCMDNMFIAAKNTDMKLYLGLNIADEWWDYTKLTVEWGTKQATAGAQIAKELYDKYYAAYTEQFAGWYWPWELYNHMNNDMADLASLFLNMYFDGLNQIDPDLPMMLSPFLNESATPEHTEAVWTRIFAVANFREGDIFCCQDSIGAGYVKIENLEPYFVAMQKAVSTEKGLHFWANNENFNTDYTPAEMERFIRQMEITSKYVENHVTFAYSHYYHPEKYPELHKQYKSYFETGEVK